MSFPEAKVVTAKEDCIIGGHYHKIKTELFILSSGMCKLNGVEMKIGELYEIAPPTYHEFEIKKGSVLIGINSHTYDPTDDYC